MGQDHAVAHRIIVWQFFCETAKLLVKQQGTEPIVAGWPVRTAAHRFFEIFKSLHATAGGTATNKGVKTIGGEERAERVVFLQEEHTAAAFRQRISEERLRQSVLIMRHGKGTHSRQFARCGQSSVANFQCSGITAVIERLGRLHFISQDVVAVSTQAQKHCERKETDGLREHNAIRIIVLFPSSHYTVVPNEGKPYQPHHNQQGDHHIIGLRRESRQQNSDGGRGKEREDVIVAAEADETADEALQTAEQEGQHHGTDKRTIESLTFRQLMLGQGDERRLRNEEIEKEENSKEPVTGNAQDTSSSGHFAADAAAQKAPVRGKKRRSVVNISRDAKIAQDLAESMVSQLADGFGIWLTDGITTDPLTGRHATQSFAFEKVIAESGIDSDLVELAFEKMASDNVQPRVDWITAEHRLVLVE